MRYFLQIIVAVITVFLIINLNENEENLNPKGVKNNLSSKLIEGTKTGMKANESKPNYLINDSLYKWDETLLDWVSFPPPEKKIEQLINHIFTSSPLLKPNSKPIVIDWELLQDIEYQLKYYEALSMEIYSPVFTKALEAIDGKEVIIEGFVIPFEESGDLLALSANPFASCFFCGKASPASVISMYTKKKKRYKMDDFRKFRGVLKLNYDDPEEYYYILSKADPI